MPRRNESRDEPGEGRLRSAWPLLYLERTVFVIHLTVVFPALALR